MPRLILNQFRWLNQIVNGKVALLILLGMFVDVVEIISWFAFFADYRSCVVISFR